MSVRVAVVGASADRAKFGNKCVRAFAARGDQLFPIHPSATQIEGWPAFPSLAAVPEQRFDIVSVYLPPTVTLGLLADWLKVAIGELWLNPGADRPEVVRRAKELGLNVICGCSILAIGANPHDFE